MKALVDERRGLDALVLTQEPTFPGCRVDARPVGLFRMRDEKGVFLCVPLTDPACRELRELAEVSARLRDEIAHFFAVYRDLDPESVVAIEGWAERDYAEQQFDLETIGRQLDEARSVVGLLRDIMVQEQT